MVSTRGPEILPENVPVVAHAEITESPASVIGPAHVAPLSSRMAPNDAPVPPCPQPVPDTTTGFVNTFGPVPV